MAHIKKSFGSGAVLAHFQTLAYIHERAGINVLQITKVHSLLEKYLHDLQFLRTMYFYQTFQDTSS
jgi:hypothetical protein